MKSYSQQVFYKMGPTTVESSDFSPKRIFKSVIFGKVSVRNGRFTKAVRKFLESQAFVIDLWQGSHIVFTRLPYFESNENSPLRSDTPPQKEYAQSCLLQLLHIFILKIFRDKISTRERKTSPLLEKSSCAKMTEYSFD